QQGQARAVAARAEDAVAAHQRRITVADAVADLGVAPQQPAVLGRHADEAAAEEADVLPHAADLGDSRGAVGGAVVRPGAAPGDGAGLLVQGDDGGVRAARGADQLVAVHQGTVAPAPRAGPPREVPGVVLAPDLLAVGSPEADQGAAGGEGVDAGGVPGGGALAEPAHQAARALDGGAERGGPELLAGRLLQGDQLLVVAPLAQDEDPAARDGDRADAVAEAGGLPRQGRPLLRPLR